MADSLQTMGEVLGERSGFKAHRADVRFEFHLAGDNRLNIVNDFAFKLDSAFVIDNIETERSETSTAGDKP